MLTSLSIYGQDYYITTEDLTLRSGAGKSYSSIIILEKGDTVKLLEDTVGYWVKVEGQEEIGFVAKNYLQQIKIIKEIESEVDPLVEGETESEFSTFFFFLLILILITVILNKKGKNNRYKSTAIILSFFLGSFGFQKFYLGKVYQGIFFILFSWTYIPMLIGFVDSIRLLIMRQVKFDDLYSQGEQPWFQLIEQMEERKFELKKGTKKEKVELKPKVLQKGLDVSQSSKNEVDDTIIDVTLEDLDLRIEPSVLTEVSTKEPPYWRFTYIYSYDEIEAATKSQKKYYLYFKNRIINGAYVNLNGNTNYAFVLYFDFINKYKKDKNINSLDQLFRFLGKSCPKTICYSSSYIEEELERISNESSIGNRREFKVAKKIPKRKEPSLPSDYHYTSYDPNINKLGTVYKSKLGLTKKETAWLNKFYIPSNVFTSTEGCCVAIIRVYLAVFKELEIVLKERKTKLDFELKKIFEEVSKIEKLEFTRYNEDYERAYSLREFKENFYVVFFKTIENLVREKYGNKRKLSINKYQPYSASVSFIDEAIGNEIEVLILEKIKDLVPPDLETELVLNAQSVNRWKVVFERLKNDFKKENQKQFIDGITRLEEANKKNDNIENIFFEASKFMAKHNKVEALNYYAKYIYYDLKSKKIEEKALTKKVQKILFKTDAQKNDFKAIIDDLRERRDLKMALEAIPEIYVLQRKKIKLDLSEIKNIEEKHEDTVQLLNEYLVDEKEKIAPEIQNDWRDTKELAVTTNEQTSIFVSEIRMQEVQAVLVEMIVNNSYVLEQSVVEQYALENGMFKNQLIDSINVACEACLEGEALIEEEDENYIIEKSYYTEITK